MPISLLTGRYVSGNREDEPYSGIDRFQLVERFGLSITSDTSAFLRDVQVNRLQEDCPKAQLIHLYYNNSVPTPDYSQAKILDIWEVCDTRRQTEFIEDGYERTDNYLLWHGTPRHNLISILNHGLTNHRGNGIFFADRVSKSMRFTDVQGPRLLLLCKVALGRIVKNQFCGHLAHLYDSAKVVGTHIPDKSQHRIIGNLVVPSGPTITRPNSIDYPFEAEYIVYNPKRICIEYVVHCQ